MATNFELPALPNLSPDIIYYDLTQLGIDAVDDGRATDLDPSDLTTYRTYSHSGSEISVSDDYYPDSFFGRKSCDIPNDSGECAHAHINMNTRTLGQSRAQWKSQFAKSWDTQQPWHTGTRPIRAACDKAPFPTEWATPWICTTSE